ncbi:MAG: trypsin-like peptidase domain-containing protein [Pseudomonadota bacterium]
MRRLLLLLLLLLHTPVQALVGGEILDWNTGGEPWTGVVAILPEQGGVYSGVLIDARHVLTAAHVVSGSRNSPERIRIRFNGPSARAELRVARAVVIHPDFQTGNTMRDARFAWHDDLALVRLADPAPDYAHVFPLDRQKIRPGQVFSLAGYGADAVPATGAVITGPSPGVLRLGRNRVEALLADDEGSGQDEVLLFQFDAPPVRSPVLRGGGPSRWVAGEAQVAFGDSGGPLFIDEAGRVAVLAIAAFNGETPQSCQRDGPGNTLNCSKTRQGALGGAGLVTPHLDWIRRILDQEYPPE